MPQSPSFLSDFVLPFQLEKAPVRGRLIRLSETVKTILEPHGYPPLVNRLLTELIGISAALSSLFKFEGVFTLQINGEGPVRLMVVDITHEGGIRACARFDTEAVLRLPGSVSSIHPVFGMGHMAFTVIQENSDERYQGIVELAGSTLTDCLHHYFRQSDQIETGMAVFTKSADLPDGTYLAGALMLQRIPGASGLTFETMDTENDAWLHSLSSLGTATAKEMLSVDLSAEDILFRLFWESGIRVSPPRSFTAQCRCSQHKVLEMLKTFAASDIQEMIQDEKITVTCEFCSQTYIFDPQTVSGEGTEGG